MIYYSQGIISVYFQDLSQQDSQIRFRRCKSKKGSFCENEIDKHGHSTFVASATSYLGNTFRVRCKRPFFTNHVLCPVVVNAVNAFAFKYIAAALCVNLRI